MKWGHRKEKVPLITRMGRAYTRNKVVSKNKGDIALYGQGGANRIAKRIQRKGMSHKKAARREVARNMLKSAAITTATLTFLYPNTMKAMGKGVASIGKIAANKAGRATAEKFVKATGGYSYKNAVKYVAMNIKNKAKGVAYYSHNGKYLN